MQPVPHLTPGRPHTLHTAACADAVRHCAMRAGVVTMSLVALGMLLCTTNVQAIPIVETGTSRARAGFNAPVEVDFPGIATASDSSTGSRGQMVSSTATPSPGGIRVQLRNKGVTPTGPEYTAEGSFSSARDTVFDYEIDPATGALDDWVQVSLGGSLSGTIRGESFGGAGRAEARVGISGVRASPDFGASTTSASGGTGPQGGFVDSLDDSDRRQTISVNEFVSTGSWWVPRGEPVSFSFGMSATADGADTTFGLGTVTVDFSNSFVLNPEEVFTILTPGITVNSPSAGIVNNRLPGDEPPPDDDTAAGTVPVPASVWLLGVGLASLYRQSARRRAYGHLS